MTGTIVKKEKLKSEVDFKDSKKSIGIKLAVIKYISVNVTNL